MKVFLVSHISDPDGVTPLILSKLVFDKVDSLLVESSVASTEVLKLINHNQLDNYDMIYITDLGLNEEVLNVIESNPTLKNKVRIFDHHIGNAIANKYSFATVIEVDEDGFKHSGTSLYYDYLLQTYTNDHLTKEAVRCFVNLVREYDTWEWVKTNNIDAKRLNNLFDIYGRNYFEEYFISFFKENDTFFFDDKELFILEIEERNIKSYISLK
jgi:oligoribonuclease NrnB/cAMP/cGMP phosphodiesterase (DHH superfamily)